MSDKFNEVKKELKIAETVSDKYSNPILHTVRSQLIQYLPIIGDYLDSVAEKNIEDYQVKKRKEFCEFILNEPELITKEKVTDINFIMEFVKTLDVINRLAQNDKILFLAALFKNTFINKNKYKIDEYEEWLHCIEELSYREMQLLIELYKCEKSYYGEFYDPQKNIREYQKIVDVWFIFLKKASKDFSLTYEDIESLIIRTTKTGFCNQEDVSVGESTLKVYYVSNYFVRFLNRIEEKI